MAARRLRELSRSRLTCIAAVVLFAPTGISHASEGPPPVRHITTYRSPSGRFALTVDPTQLHGGGPCHCRVERDGKLVWEKKLGYTLWEAVIADDGVVAGYAYTAGWAGIDARGTSGDIVIVILSPDGTSKLVDRRPRNGGEIHGPPEPTSRGCFLDQFGHRFVVRFDPKDWDEGGEVWETYSLTEHKRLSDIRINKPGTDTDNRQWYFNPVVVQPVTDTELTTVAWYMTSRGSAPSGLRISLIDSNAEEIWHLARPNEFAKTDISAWDLRLLQLFPSSARANFIFRSPAEQARITFSITRMPTDAREWIVRETARINDRVPTSTNERIDPPLSPITLAPRGIIKFPNSSEPLDRTFRVFTFDFDSKGRIGFVNDSPGGGFEFVLYSPDGKREKTVPLPKMELPEFGRPYAVFVGDDKWILCACSPGENGRPIGHVLNADTGVIARIKNLESPIAHSCNLKGGPNCFALMGSYKDPRIVVFDGAGKKIWEMQHPGGSAEDIAIGPHGEVAVLNNSQDHITVQEPSGKYNRRIDLIPNIRPQFNYLSGLEADDDGGWILHDFQGTPRFFMIGPRGKKRGEFTTRYNNGKPFDPTPGNVKRSTDGSLWTTDGVALLRLTEDGVVDFTIGRSHDSESLGGVECATVDHKGQFYLVDAYTDFVHVFDIQGKPIRIIKPRPTDLDDESGPAVITVDGEGSIYFIPESNSLELGGYLKIRANGERVGFEAAAPECETGRCLFRPGTQERLVLDFERAYMINAEGKTIRKVERRADRRWLDRLPNAAFAPDGSFVVLSRDSNWFQMNNQAVTIFSPNGDAIRTFDITAKKGFDHCATNGKSIVVMSSDMGVIIDATTGSTKQWIPPGVGGDFYWEPLISPDGKELWCFDSGVMTVHRFAMP